MKFINIIFPLIDYLYIYQNLEYESVNFLKWWGKFPFKRNLQRKHQIDLTSKALMLLLISSAIILIKSILDPVLLYNYLYPGCNIFNSPGQYLLWAVILFLIYSQLSPIFLVAAQIILYPLDFYQKQKILSLAQAKLKNLPNLKVVGITGSYAKTSTKDILYTLLWKKFRVVKTPKSFNTPVSISRSILELVKDSTQVLLVEMDAYHPGEINQLSRLVEPDLGIITGITAQHLERFGSMDKLIKTQFEISQNLPAEGNLFLNSSDAETLNSYPDNTLSNLNLKFYGLDKNLAQFYATDIKMDLNGTSFLFHHDKNQAKVHLSLFGTHHLINFLGAAAIAYELGMNLEEISERAAKILPTPHRLEIKTQGQITIIDNSYNTNPTSTQTALELLAKYPGKQKILITPGLVELGKENYSKNCEFGTKAAKVADKVIIVGEHAREPISKGLKDSGFNSENIYQVKTLKEGFDILAQFSTPETVVSLENDLPDQYF